MKISGQRAEIGDRSGTLCGVHGCDGQAMLGARYCRRCFEEIDALEKLDARKERELTDEQLRELAKTAARRQDRWLWVRKWIWVPELIFVFAVMIYFGLVCSMALAQWLQ